jgi:choline-sulfatase
LVVATDEFEDHNENDTNMKRRAFIKSVVAGSAASGALARRPSAAEEMPAPRPNFLFIIADDLTYRGIRALFDPQVSTPNLDRLAAKGCAFTHCFHQGSWTGAVCIASRTMLLTGLSTFQAEPVEPSPLCDFTPLWGQTLRAAGYHTYMAGKWHLDPTMMQRCFDEMGPIGLGMFESVVPDAYHRPKPGNTWTPWNTKLKGHWLSTKTWQNSENDEIHHSSQIWADCAVDHLLQRVPKLKQPFFMYIGFNAPHDPRQAPKEFVDMFPPGKIEVPPNYLPEFPFDNGDLRGRDEQLAPFPRTREAVQLHRSEYYAIVAHMDNQIGRILDALERSGKADNTYVILTADHGLAVGQHGLMGKQNLFDHSIRIPWIIRGPGVPQGKTVNELVYQHSTFATTCELAKIAVPKSVEFPSLAGLIHGPATPPHDAIFSRYLNVQRAVRTKDYKLIVYPQVQRSQLFDMNEDPWEITDLSASPSLKPVREQLLQRLRTFQHELGDGLDLDHPSVKKPVHEW